MRTQPTGSLPASAISQTGSSCWPTSSGTSPSAASTQCFSPTSTFRTTSMTALRSPSVRTRSTDTLDLGMTSAPLRAIVTTLHHYRVRRQRDHFDAVAKLLYVARRDPQGHLTNRQTGRRATRPVPLLCLTATVWPTLQCIFFDDVATLLYVAGRQPREHEDPTRGPAWASTSNSPATARSTT